MREQREEEQEEIQSGLKFGDVVPTETADRELRWFFNEAESECEQPSNYGRMLGGISPTSLAAVEARAEAIHAAGKIRAWLAKLSKDEQLVLEGAYRERVCPQAVWRVLGPLSGAVVALRTVRVLHLRALANARTEAATPAEWVEELAKTRPDALLPWRVEAERNGAMAIRAYERARGKGECAVPTEESE